MGKKKRRRIKVLWWTLGQAIVFGFLAILTIVSLIIKIYPITIVAFFCLLYGNFTMLLGKSLGNSQDYADQNVNGSDKIGDYDSKADAYLDRDYK